jgi:uncharacterized membrane protein
MNKFAESHKRTIVKTLTIRVLFTLSHLLNGYIVTGDLVIGAQIAGVAALINMSLFWIHDRVWEFASWNRKPEDTKLFVDGHPRTISKSITWRALITINNFMIPFILTGSWQSAAVFLGIATVLNIVVYYAHERVWNLVSWGRKITVDETETIVYK